jgi:4-amino-4-deoxy-L-arabinose transferase-like glycosyltransferase
VKLSALLYAFPPEQTAFLYAGLSLGIVALWLAWKDRYPAAIILLTLAMFCLGMFAATLDPFLHDWDERLHALVAKNMMSDPLVPVLHLEHPLYYDYRSWSDNHIWLHKQPWFLWQMALSMKIFGISEWALRLPSVLMSVVLVPAIYRMGTLLMAERRPAFLGALFFTGCHFHLTMLTGAAGMEHNTMAFTCYVALSIWAWLEYERSRKWHWVWATGLFAGIAVLNKWLPGLLVFGGWGLAVLLNSERRTNWRSYLPPAMAFAVALATFMPWQIYTFIAFPQEALWEYQYNQRHLTEVVEGHRGSWDYHLSRFTHLYGLIGLMALPGIWLLWKRARKRQTAFAVVAMLLVVYLVFSLSATKMVHYTYMAAAIVFVLIGAGVNGVLLLLQKIQVPGLVSAMVVLAAWVLTMQVPRIHGYHMRDFPNHYGYPTYRSYKLENKEVFYSLARHYGEGKNIVLVLNPFQPVELEFYTGLRAYGRWPHPHELGPLIQGEYNLVILDSTHMPEYLREYPYLTFDTLHTVGWHY